jgi:hypothetical protein
MTDARSVAERFAAKFLEQGSYYYASSPRGPSSQTLSPAASGAIDAYFEEIGFEGLAVQSVGYEAGAENPRVHIYVTKGSRRAVQALSDDDEGVQVEITRMGKLIVRPEQASAATNSGKIFTRKDRIACGSSCAPTGENYAGTLGALVRKTGRNKPLYVLSNNRPATMCR